MSDPVDLAMGEIKEDEDQVYRSLFGSGAGWGKLDLARDYFVGRLPAHRVDATSEGDVDATNYLDADPGFDNSTKMQDAINATPDYGRLLLPRADIVAGGFTIDHPMQMLGRGRERGTRFLTPPEPGTTPLLTVAPGDNVHDVRLADFGVDCTANADALATAIRCENFQDLDADRLKVRGGQFTLFDMSTCHFSRVDVYDPPAGGDGWVIDATTLNHKSVNMWWEQCLAYLTRDPDAGPAAIRSGFYVRRGRDFHWDQSYGLKNPSIPSTMQYGVMLDLEYAKVLSGVTATASTDTLHYVGHGYSSGQLVVPSAFGGGFAATGVTSGRGIYVIVIDADNFQIALTSGGLATDITNDGVLTLSSGVGSTGAFFFEGADYDGVQDNSAPGGVTCGAAYMKNAADVFINDTTWLSAAPSGQNKHAALVIDGGNTFDIRTRLSGDPAVVLRNSPSGLYFEGAVGPACTTCIFDIDSNNPPLKISYNIDNTLCPNTPLSNGLATFTKNQKHRLVSPPRFPVYGPGGSNGLSLWNPTNLIEVVFTVEDGGTGNLRICKPDGTVLGYVLQSGGFGLSSAGDWIRSGTGSPEGVVTAIPPSLWFDRTNGDVYMKKTGTGNTGWLKLATV